MALEMLKSCESCGVELAEAGLAFICAYECTFCEKCSAAKSYVCPKCNGKLVRRPRRSPRLQP